MFQFTQPKRAATSKPLATMHYYFSFNSRSPSGLRRVIAFCQAILSCFNSRSPSGLRRDLRKCPHVSTKFQFTQPKRAATHVGAKCTWRSGVSIHAAQAGCDVFLAILVDVGKCFNSRSPSGLRLSSIRTLCILTMFQFTQPKRAATRNNRLFVLK